MILRSRKSKSLGLGSSQYSIHCINLYLILNNKAKQTCEDAIKVSEAKIKEYERQIKINEERIEKIEKILKENERDNLI